MLTGELRSKIEEVWNAFWAGGIANPLEVNSASSLPLKSTSRPRAVRG